MSEHQQVAFKNWQFYVFFATTIFAAGGAWHRLNELSDWQVQHGVWQRENAAQRERMQESIFRLQEQIRSLEQRLEAKKIVFLLATMLDMAGEAYGTSAKD